jgi:hypothetical protein
MGLDDDLLDTPGYDPPVPGDPPPAPAPPPTTRWARRHEHRRGRPVDRYIRLDPPCQHARHYTGHAEPGTWLNSWPSTAARGARLLRQPGAMAAGTWPVPSRRPDLNGRSDAQAVPRSAPTVPPAAAVTTDVTPRRQRLAARTAAPADPAVPLPRLPAPPPAEQGRRAGERFLATREGWPADRLAAALEYVTGPYRQNGPRNQASAREMAAFTATVTAGIQAQRATGRAQPALIAQQKGTTAVSTPISQPGPAPEHTTDREKGAATARLIVTRQIEAGHTAEQIADRWEAALAGHDPQTATPEQQAWHDAARDEAHQLIQDWRDMQRGEAEQAQAARDEWQAAQDAGDRRANAARDAGEQLAAEPWRISEPEPNDMETARPEPEGPRYPSEEREPEAGPGPEHELEAAG